MIHSSSKTRFACVVLLVALLFVAVFAVFCSSPDDGVLTVVAQAPPANNTTVTNNVTVAPGSISLGTTVQASGQVTVGTTPLANAAVSLHMGDVILASAQTNGNGGYSFTAPVGVYYFPAAFSNGATIYTVAEPGNASLPSAPSTVTTVSVDSLPLYLIIAAVTVVILIVLYGIARRMRGQAVLPLARRRPAEQTVSTPAHASRPEASAQNQQELVRGITPAVDAMAETRPEEAPELEPALPAEREAPPVDEELQEPQPPEPEEKPPESVAETGPLKEAHDFFEHGNDREAVNALYDAALTALATTHELTIAPSATHWEKYYAIEAAVPDVQAPLRTLTLVYERANYAGKTLTDEQRNAALEAFRAITAHVEAVKDNA
jgi:hypothetical protein